MPPKRDKISLFLFIDAFGWEVRRRHPGFLEGLVVDSQPLATILGYSSACDPSIISGLVPAEHGLWSSYYYDPAGSPFKGTWPLRLLPGALANRGRVRSRLNRWVARRCGISGYFQLYSVPFRHLPLFNYAEQKRIWEPGGLPRGESVFDRMARAGIPYHVHDSQATDKERFARLLADLRRQAIDFAYCSFGRLDALMHAKGNDHPEIGDLLAWYDAQIRAILAAAEANYREVSWFVFTDHGMHNVTGTHDLMADIAALGLRWNRDYAAFYDATMARFWFFNEAARAAVARRLEHLPQGRILADDELKRHGVWFEDGHYGELVFLMNPGIQLVPSFMGAKPCQGMHGYDPAEPDSLAAISSNQPIPASVVKIQHIHQLMLAELGLPHPERKTP